MSHFHTEFTLDSTVEVPGGDVEYDSSREAYRLTHDWSTNESLTVSVLAVVEVASTVSTDDLPPLHDYIDPDGLDNLFAPTNSGPERACGKVTFPYGGCLVTIAADGVITVQRIHTEDDVE